MRASHRRYRHRQDRAGQTPGRSEERGPDIHRDHGPELSGLDFYRILAAEFHIGRRIDSRETFLVDATRFYLRAFSADQTMVLIIDEAQRLNHEILTDIVVLSNLQRSGRKLVKILFVGSLPSMTS